MWTDKKLNIPSKHESDNVQVKNKKKEVKKNLKVNFVSGLEAFKMFLPREMTAVVYEAMEKTAESFYMLMLL